MVRILTAITLLAISACVSGCGGDKSMVDSEPFRIAVVDYLEKGSYDLAIDEFKEIAVDGDNATAKVSLGFADPDAASIKTRWTFDFERDGSAWRATGHKE